MMMEDGMQMGIGQLVMVLVWVVLVIVPFWKITTKAGYSGWLSLLVVVPIVNLIFIYFLAFSKWPSLRQSGS